VAVVLKGGDFVRVSVAGPGMPRQEIPLKRLKCDKGN
jgi:hypothetical protein